MPRMAFALCDAYPTSSYWPGLTHERMYTYVDVRYGGDWQAHMARLDRYIERIRSEVSRDGQITLKKEGNEAQISGRALFEYLQLIEKRREVDLCLTDVQAVANIETAAGGPVSLSRGVLAQYEDQIRATGGVPLELGVADIASGVNAECLDGSVNFRLRNWAGAWPARGRLEVYRLGVGPPQKVSTKVTQAKAGQIVEFLVPKSRNLTGELGFFLHLLWKDRAFKLDHQIKCAPK